MGMDEIKALEELWKRVEPQKSKISKENKDKAVRIMLSLSQEKNNYKQIAEYMNKFPYSVCRDFFEKFVLTESDNNIAELANAIVSCEGVNKDAILYRGFTIAIVFMSNEKYQISFLILDYLLKELDNSGKFPRNSVSIFNKLLSNKNQYMLNIIDQIMKDEIKCTKEEKERFERFLKEIDNTKTSTEQDKTSERDVFDNNMLILLESAAAIKQIDKSQNEILTLIHKLVENNKMIETLSAAVAYRDEEITTMKANLTEKENQLFSLKKEVNIKEKQLDEEKQQINDLTERLRTSIQMNETAKKQETVTLKNDISDALKLDYADFIRSMEKPYNEDLFEAYRLTLSRIFKLLKRFGIDCQ